MKFSSRINSPKCHQRIHCSLNVLRHPVYQIHTHILSHIHTHTHNHRDSRLHYPSYPAIARVRSPTSRRPPSLSHSLSFSLCLSLTLSLSFCLISTLSPLSPMLPTDTLPVTNPHFQPPAAVVGSCALHTESNREHFHPLPTVEQPHPGRGAGDTFYP